MNRVGRGTLTFAAIGCRDLPAPAAHSVLVDGWHRSAVCGVPHSPTSPDPQ